MVSPVKSRLTHYENLGLTPAATSDEVAEAFAKLIHIRVESPEEAVEHANRIYIAYETLRDPIKRRAYDAAIGLWDGEADAKQKPEPIIGVGAPQSPEHGLYAASPGITPNPVKRDPSRARRASKAATEWPVPRMKSFVHRAATHLVVGGTSRSAKRDRRLARPDDKPTIDRQRLHSAEQRTSAAAPTEAEAISEDFRGDVQPRPGQAKSVPASQGSLKRNYDGAGAGVFIATLGVLTLVVSLIKGTDDHVRRPPQRTVLTAKQPVHSTGRAAPAAEQAVPTEEAAPLPTDDLNTPVTVPALQMSTMNTVAGIFAPSATAKAVDVVDGGGASPPSEVAAEVSSSGFVELAPQLAEETQVGNDLRPEANLFSGIPLEQVVDRRATDLQFEPNATRQAAATPFRQSATQQARPPVPQAVRPPAVAPRLQPVSRAAASASPQPTAHGPIGSSRPQRAERQAARTPPQWPISQVAARTPPQQAVYRQAATPTQQRTYGQVTRPGAKQSTYRQMARIPRGQNRYRQTPAKWLAGGLVNSDNPGGRFRGTVYVQFTVQTNGRVTGCRASSSTRNRALEARTCGLVEKRLLFSPALDSLGRRIPSVLQTSYTWGRVV